MSRLFTFLTPILLLLIQTSYDSDTDNHEYCFGMVVWQSYLNTFRATGLLLHPLKTKKQEVFRDIKISFRIVWKETSSMKWVKPFLAGGFHHCELTCHNQDLNFPRTQLQTSLNEIVPVTTPQRDRQIF